MDERVNGQLGRGSGDRSCAIAKMRLCWGTAEQRRHVRMRDKCFISGRETDVSQTRQPSLMTRWRWMKGGAQGDLQRWHKGAASP